jgi:hypothetical protein
LERKDEAKSAARLPIRWGAAPRLLFSLAT